jgi:hypothetical protein
MIPGENPKPSGKLNRAALIVATPGRKHRISRRSIGFLNFFSSAEFLWISPCATQDPGDEKCIKLPTKTDFLLAHSGKLLRLTPM